MADGWLLPRAAERRLGRVGDADAAFLSLGDVAYPDEPEPRWTTVGSVGGGGFGAVDPAGLLTPRPHGWSLDWWVGADDRWYLPAREASTRQALFEGIPVIETRVRVPGGDAVHRVYGVGGSGDVAVVEIENASPAPLALALAVRPYHPAGPRAVEHVAIDGTAIRVDGEVGIVLARPPRRVAGGGAEAGDALQIVVGGEAADAQTLVVDDQSGLATAAVVLPLAHRATARFAVPLVAGAGTISTPDRLPPRDAVVRGWRAQLGGGLQVEAPDDALLRAIDAARAWILLADDGVEPVPAPWTGPDRDAAAAVVTEARAWGLGRHVDEVAGGIPRRLRRRQRRAGVPPDATARVDELLRAAGATFAWGQGGEGHHAGVAAEFLRCVRGMLAQTDRHGVAILPGFPDAWRGAPVEAHRVPVGGTELSFALRWHDDRPALLWESSAPLTVRAPALDPDWRGEGATGEALLSAPTPGS